MKSGKIITTNLRKALSSANTEKFDVTNAWRTAFEACFPGSIACLVRDDGILRTPTITALLEFKGNKDLKDALRRSKPIVQSLGYLKRMLDRGEDLVKVIFIGDRDECFCISTKGLVGYLSRSDIDWESPSSGLSEKYPTLVKEILEDKNIRPSFVYSVDDEGFNFLDVVEEMKSISEDKPYITPVTEKNFQRLYKYFDEHIVMGKRFEKGDVYAEDNTLLHLPHVFLTFFTASKEIYHHPEKKYILVVKGKEIRVSPSEVEAFLSRVKNVSPSEVEKIVANADRLLEDLERRYTGAYFTPKIWVDEAHKMITESPLGENWKDENVVWDCAAGTANLTRDYKFKELYISTLEQGDIDTIKARNYNQGATIFQYDFLSEIYSPGSILEEDKTGIYKVPFGLKQAFEDGKKILFLINPPFGKSGGKGNTEKKKGVAKNTVNIEMLRKKMGGCSSQLYTQFAYKILSLKLRYPQAQISVAFFSQYNFMTAPSYKKFRDFWESSFAFQDGILFSARHFSDILSDWGISFTVWNDSGEKKRKILILKDTDKDTDSETKKIKDVGIKELYSLDRNTCLAWTKKDIVGLPTIDAPQLSSAIQIKQNGCGKLVGNALGSILTGRNNVQDNNSYVILLSACSFGTADFSIIHENFRKVVAFFTAKKSIKPAWFNCEDQYLIPNTQHPGYEQWNNDAIIYSLFNSSSGQSSLRQIDYKGKKRDIKNEFFFLSNQEMKGLAEISFNEMYQDAKDEEDRYVYKLLQTAPLSEDAQTVLHKAQELVRKSMKIRKEYHEQYPERHLQAWDAGWAQLRPMLKEHFKEEFNEFRELYTAFENRMREGVYKFGFLRK
jgi:hypothetical protein